VRVANNILIPEFRSLIAEGKEVRFIPRGVSMRPFIEGDVDSVVLVHSEHAKVGDVVLAEVEPERYVLHRVIRSKGEQLVLMGDGNLMGEEYCSQKDVVGRVESVFSPCGRRKYLTRGWVWRHTLHLRPFMLKIYRYLIKQKKQGNYARKKRI